MIKKIIAYIISPIYGLNKMLKSQLGTLNIYEN